MPNSLSQTIAAHIVDARFEQLSSRAVQMTKYSLLDAIGVMLGASGAGEGCDAFAQIAIESQARHEATILGYRQRTSAALAALANGAMAHALDFEDAFDGAPVHPNAQTIPAALAIAESMGTISGREFISALAVGCDLVCRLGSCLTENVDDYGWYPPPILGALGATATVARLLNLDQRQTLDALSLTLCQSSCSAEIKHNPQSVIRSVRDGFASHAAVIACQLAKKGIRGFDEPFEGKAGFFNNFARGHYDRDKLLHELGQRFDGEYVSFKPWPACRGTHAYIEAALQLKRQHQFTEDQIASVTLVGHRVQTMLYEPQVSKRKPQTAIDAKFSLPYTVATALCHDEVTLNSFNSNALDDARVLKLAQRVSFTVANDSHASDNATRGHTTINLVGGQRFSSHIENPLGHPSRPMTESAVLCKFEQCAGLARLPMGDVSRNGVIEQVLHIERAAQLDQSLFGLFNS
jgi:2-methylcitrate dehydratase PrpD